MYNTRREVHYGQQNHMMTTANNAGGYYQHQQNVPAMNNDVVDNQMPQRDYQQPQDAYNHNYRSSASDMRGYEQHTPHYRDPNAGNGAPQMNTQI